MGYLARCTLIVCDTKLVIARSRKVTWRSVRLTALEKRDGFALHAKTFGAVIGGVLCKPAPVRHLAIHFPKGNARAAPSHAFK